MTAPYRWVRYTWASSGTRCTAVLENPTTDGATIRGMEVGPELEHIGMIEIAADDITGRTDVGADYFLIGLIERRGS